MRQILRDFPGHRRKYRSPYDIKFMQQHTDIALEADDQPSNSIENREMGENKASGESPQGSVTDAANFEITENEDGTVTISRYIGTETDIGSPHRSAGKLFPRLETSRVRPERLKAARA